MTINLHMEIKMDSTWLTLSELAYRNGRSYPQTLRLLKADPVASTWIGRNRFISPADAAAWLERHPR